MNVLSALWRDERGLVLTAEAVTLGTLGVVGATVGLGALSKSIKSEMEDFAFALRGLDQSYSLPAQHFGDARTAGSDFTQMPVEQARAEIRDQLNRDNVAVRPRHRSSQTADERVGAPAPE